MPIYEYQCSDCANSFEVMHLNAESYKSLECPKCHSRQVSREMSTFAVSALAPGAAPMCDRTGACASPNIPGCASGACGL
ncbi:MAG: zinc ribbon domain-containing protein [Nitrospinota bacterium]|nr:zinc ribbon domain-containing protein [Nitrospinota bacterium]MDH5679348.1 zinc ribbon domain-containing protein [Nitrospinota bacterium]MDH5756170.1 zinc ribbon domain-containing protein [Nitrospinota bacterium]